MRRICNFIRFIVFLMFFVYDYQYHCLLLYYKHVAIYLVSFCQYLLYIMVKQPTHWSKTAFLAFLLRVSLIFFLSLYENIYHHDLKLTDIDYKVYSDSTLHSSPYQRHTYRYSPILSYLMQLNYTIHQAIGKIIFALFDVVAIYLLHAIMQRYFKESNKKNHIINAQMAVKIYAYNPLFVYLTVRGSCQSITLALFYAFWYYYFGGKASGSLTIQQMEHHKIGQSSDSKLRRYAAYGIYGLLVHFRIYPIVLLPIILMYQYRLAKDNKMALIKNVVQIGLVSGGVFLALGFIFYSLYGYQFIQQTYLYHLYRKDNRHSFSPFFYQIYLNYQSEFDTISRSVIRTLPTLYCIFTLALRFTKNYSLFALQFLAVVSFVTFNKVITMQYYMWVIGSVILVLPQTYIFLQRRYRMGLSYALQYFFPIFVWIWLSLRLQGAGQNYLHTLWLLCLFQVGFQLWVLGSFVKLIKRFNPVQERKEMLQAAKRVLAGKND